MKLGLKAALALMASMFAVLDAGAAEPPVEASWNLRLRHETVDDDAFTRDARADTLRVRAGLRFRLGDSWSLLLEGEGVAANGAYNSGSNGRLDRPVVLDPEGAEINQALLAWQGERAAAILGRQRILLDNQRFVGNVGWRQNEQTFDAVSFEARPAPEITLRWSWIDRVHRVAGDRALSPLARERDLDTYLANLAWTHGTQALVSYAYLHEDRDVATDSSNTFGLRWTGKTTIGDVAGGWAVELAQQRDGSGSPLHFSHRYTLLEPYVALGGVTLRAGRESLAGNGTHALQTPLATLHAFDGWADRFLVTPPNGLVDRYATVSGETPVVPNHPLAWQVTWHRFDAEHGGSDYGREWDASLAMPLAEKLQLLLKFADYRSEGFGRDSRKLWLQLEWSGVH